MNYSSGPAFREAIEQRIRNSAEHKPSDYITRARRTVLFDRLLARLLKAAPGMWILKGGVALDFRFGDRARTTKDLDLASDAEEDEIVQFVSAAADVELDDFFSFVVVRLNSIVEEGDAKALRFRVRGELGGRRFENVLLDVGLGTQSTGALELLDGRDFLSFAGIDPVKCPTISLALHLAEKLHAYARIYSGGRLSSRVKDLVDMVLIATEHSLSSDDVHKAIDKTFATREAAPLPNRLHPPPHSWGPAYRELVEPIGLDPDVNEGYRIAAAFFDPLLSGEVGGDAVWSPDVREWHSP